jgi:hypothetical protein
VRDPRIRRYALALIFCATLCIALAYASAFRRAGVPAWGNWLLACGLSLLLVSTLALGAARSVRSLGRLAVPLAFTFVVLLGGFGFALWLPAAERAGMPLLLGLPPRAAIVLYGIGLLPLLVLPLVFALTFDELGLSDEDVQRVKDAAAQRRASAGSP